MKDDSLMDELDKLRKEINEADSTIIKTLAKRRDLSLRVIEVKAKSSRPLRDEKREQELLARVIAMGRECGLDGHYVTRVFHEIIDDSVRSQQLFLLGENATEEPTTIRVGFQGIHGAYSQLASEKFFARQKATPNFVGYKTFLEVVRSLESGDIDYALLPVENTTAGSINQVYDLLTDADVSIVGEEIFPVEHCLLALEEVPLSNIRRVMSHPQALMQCEKFLSSLENCQSESFADTAMAVRKVKEDNDLSQAAIASEDAAKLYGLKVLKRHLADQRNNYTRFLVAMKKPTDPVEPVDTRIPCKTSLVLATSHEEGALLRALSLLHEHGINLTKLESRPRPGYPFQYRFFLDFEGNIADEYVAVAVEGLKEVTSFLRVLGSYPMEQRGRTAPLQESVVSSGVKSNAQRAKSKTLAATSKTADTIITVGNTKFGTDEFVIVAGPAAVESREQILACARHVKESGGKILHARCFGVTGGGKNSSSNGAERLDLLCEAGRHYDLPVLTEVRTVQDVERAADKADIVLLGGRNMENEELLDAVGRMGRPVFLTRAETASMEEFAAAAATIFEGGNRQVILCDRDSSLGSLLSLRERTRLPVVVDPSSSLAQLATLPLLVRALRDVKTSGLTVEISPESSDGDSVLSFAQFSELMGAIYG